MQCTHGHRVASGRYFIASWLNDAAAKEITISRSPVRLSLKCGYGRGHVYVSSSDDRRRHLSSDHAVDRDQPNRRIKAARFGRANEFTDKLTVVICAFGFLACVYAAEKDGLEGWAALGIWSGLAVAVGFWTDHLMRIITLDARSGSPRDADNKVADPGSGTSSN